MERNIEVYKTTTDRLTYNKSRKCYLETHGDIHCGRCSYNKGENIKHGYKKNYSWKLLTNKRKQWQYKPASNDINHIRWWIGGIG